MARSPFGHPHLHAPKGQRSAGETGKAHFLAVFHPQPPGVRRGQMDMPLGGDNPVGQLHPAVPIAERNSGGARYVPRKAYRRTDAQGNAVGEGEFHLGMGAFGPQHHHVGKGTLRPFQGDPLGTDELSRLGERAHRREGGVGAEEGGHVFFGQVDVPPAGLQLHPQGKGELVGEGFNQVCLHNVPPFPESSESTKGKRAG